jgi:hypothetical protein
MLGFHCPKDLAGNQCGRCDQGESYNEQAAESRVRHIGGLSATAAPRLE